jgi:REP element-mobilizing transposase RayT
MPRVPRLDYPGALHHVICRGIERGRVFRSDQDHRRFLDRLAELVQDSKAALYAWSLMPNLVLCAAAHNAWFETTPAVVRISTGTCK